MTDYLQILFARAGLTCVSVSLDDFYLTAEEQLAVSSANDQNDLLKYRGNG